MSMIDTLKKMAVILEKRQDALFSYDVYKQKRYIAKLGNPRDGIERSFFQYKCQMKFNGNIITFFLNMLSFPLVMIYWIKYGSKVQHDKLEKKSAVFFRNGIPKNVLPNSLKLRYSDIEDNPIEGILLTNKDKIFLKKIICRYPFSWQFILKCLIKVGRYSFSIEKYSPEAIVVCAEYSFTSSVLTLYCKQRKIDHINVMHGEKLFYMRDSFFKFDECYIWDEYYKKIFISLRAVRNQFIIEVPPSLRFDEKMLRSSKYDFTYYLGSESEQTLIRISEKLYQLHIKGKKISVRPHPRYSDLGIIKKKFFFANIENIKKITIEQSLLQTCSAISLYSTVLNQALYNSIPIVIDDLSNPRNFRKLNELGYICLNKKHRLLSEIMEENV